MRNHENHHSLILQILFPVVKLQKQQARKCGVVLFEKTSHLEAVTTCLTNQFDHMAGFLKNPKVKESDAGFTAESTPTAA